MTVAFCAEQQRGQRPADQDRAPDDHRLGALSSTPASAQSSMTPSGVQGTSPGRPCASRPALGRGQPVDVLGRIDRGDHRVLVERSGSGIWTRIPSTDSSAFELRHQVQQLVLGDVGAEPVVDRADPGLLAGLDLVADVDVRGRVVADQNGRQARRRVALGGERLDVLADLRADAAATALPSMIRALNAHEAFLSGA